MESSSNPEPLGTSQEVLQVPDGDELYIRSLTTLLHLVGHRVSTSTAHLPSSEERFIGEVASLFVSGTKADVAAVSFWHTQESLKVEVSQHSSRFDVVKNRLKWLATRPEDLPSDGDLAAELSKDPLRFVLRRGIEVIPPEVHGQQLQRLLRNISADSFDKGPIKDLRNYVYSFCMNKIQKRLLSKPVDYDDIFLSLFLSPETAESPFKRADIAEDWPQYVDLPSELAAADEEWLVEHVARFISPAPATQGNPRRLSPDPETRWGVLQAFTRTLSWVLNYSQTLSRLMDPGNVGPDNETEGNRALFEDTLRAFDRYMGLLWMMVHRSPTLYLVVKMLEPELQKRLGMPRSLVLNAKVEAKLSYGNSPPRSAAGQSSAEGGVTGKPSTTLLLTSSMANTNPSVIDGEQIRDQEGGESDIENEEGDGGNEEEESDDEDEENNDEDDVASVPQTAPPSILQLVRSWLKRATQWNHTLGKLCYGAAQYEIHTKFVEIGVHVAPEPAMATCQAALEETVQLIPAKAEFDGRMTALRRLAERHHLMMKGRVDDPVNSRRKVEKPKQYLGALGALCGMTGKDGQPISWVDSFTGGIHCEAYLATLMRQGSVGKGKIGVSKRCCFCCSRYLIGSGASETVPPTHGKVYPWACPPGTPKETQRSIIEDLKEELALCIDKHQERTKSIDSASASSSPEPPMWPDELDEGSSWENMSKPPSALMFSRPKSKRSGRAKLASKLV